MKPRIALLAALIGMITAAASAVDYAGKYKGASLGVELNADHSLYRGQMTLGDKQFPLKAHEANGSLQGTFNSGGNEFDFTATLIGNELTLTTGGATYKLKKEAGAVNPLAAHHPLNPLAGGAVVDAPAGYTIINTTDSGRAISTEKPDATTMLTAMKTTFAELEKYFGARPSILGAYEDQQTRKSGTATFSVNRGGKQLNGLVSCRIGDHGASVVVIFCNANASTAEWKKLAAAPQAAGALPDLKRYDFPDGTGSIGLPDGWTTNAQTCMAPVTIKGPADQEITLGFCLSVMTPDSQLVLLHNQLVANAAQWGMQPPPPLQGFIAPYTTDPAEALKALVPQINRMSQQAGGDAYEIDNLKTLPQEARPYIDGGKAALLTYGVTHIARGSRKHFSAGARVDVCAIVEGSWMFYTSWILGPDNTFAADTPLMLAICNSLKENAQVIAAKTQQNLDAQNQRFAQLQQAHRTQMEGFEEYNKGWQRRELQNSRTNADFDEVIRGYRTVLDTRTDERASVDLGNVNQIVDKLNEADPGRYKQIPLRDEMYPRPGN